MMPFSNTRCVIIRPLGRLNKKNLNVVKKLSPPFFSNISSILDHFFLPLAFIYITNLKKKLEKKHTAWMVNSVLGLLHKKNNEFFRNKFYLNGACRMIVCSIYVITISKKLSFFANMATFLAIFGRKTHKNLSPFRKLKKKWIWLLYPFRGCKSLAFTRSRGCKSRQFLFLFGNFLPLNGLLIVSTINQSIIKSSLIID